MTTTTTRNVHTILTGPAMHWVGDGFPVRSIFSPQSVQNHLSPFIMMDYAAPRKFEPATAPRGVDSHPHRGFETVTVVWQGELEHRDSAGNAGAIGPGDVQWMTAASGVLHEEKHSRNFTANGGTFEVAQLWVNLPAKDKMSKPRYQELTQNNIPVVELPDNAGRIRLIAGDYENTKGAAKTVTPVILWDLHLVKGAEIRLPIPDGHNASVFARRGSVDLGPTQALSSGELAVYEKNGGDIIVKATADTDLLILAGEPINEPVVPYGPFVMNTPQEIQQAINDFRTGKFGELD